MKPEIHFAEDECPVAAPKGFPVDDELHFEIEMLDFAKAKARMLVDLGDQMTLLFPSMIRETNPCLFTISLPLLLLHNYGCNSIDVHILCIDFSMPLLARICEQALCLRRFCSHLSIGIIYTLNAQNLKFPVRMLNIY